MKFKFVLILSLFISKALYSNGISDYFPLKVGNVWSYDWIFTWGNGGRANISITKDTIFNSHKYYLCNFPTISFSPQWLRVDSVSGNIYLYSPNGGCSYHPGENLIDSLFAKKYDTTNSCGISPRICSDTGSVQLFGNTISKKVFGPVFVISPIGRYYAKNIGPYKFEEGDPLPTYYNLRGCVIDGIVYGDTNLTDIQQISNTSPDKFSLEQNYPNPFNPSTIINYSIPSNVKSQMSNVKLIVYNNLGKEIATLVNEKQNAGSYSVDFNGEGLSSGIYFYKLEAGDFVETKRMILLK